MTHFPALYLTKVCYHLPTEPVVYFKCLSSSTTASQSSEFSVEYSCAHVEQYGVQKLDPQINFSDVVLPSLCLVYLQL